MKAKEGENMELSNTSDLKQTIVTFKAPSADSCMANAIALQTNKQTEFDKMLKDLVKYS